MIKAASARKRARKYFAPQNEGVHRKCDHPGCNKDGEFKAPKNRSLKDYYWFCLEHVQEYNSRWNYYTDDDSEPEHEAFRKKTRFSGFHSKIKYKFGCDLDEELEFLHGFSGYEKYPTMFISVGKTAAKWNIWSCLPKNLILTI